MLKRAWRHFQYYLTHWGRVTHICVSKLTIIDADNGLSPGRRQAIIWTNAGILLIGPFGTNFSDILSKIHIFSFTKMYLKTTSAKWRPFRLGLSVLTGILLFSGTNATRVNTPVDFIYTLIKFWWHYADRVPMYWFKYWHSDGILHLKAIPWHWFESRFLFCRISFAWLDNKSMSLATRCISKHDEPFSELRHVSIESLIWAIAM